MIEVKGGQVYFTPIDDSNMFKLTITGSSTPLVMSKDDAISLINEISSVVFPNEL